jgi:hypothetical protein
MKIDSRSCCINVHRTVEGSRNVRQDGRVLILITEEEKGLVIMIKCCLPLVGDAQFSISSRLVDIEDTAISVSFCLLSNNDKCSRIAKCLLISPVQPPSTVIRKFIQGS